MGPGQLAARMLDQVDELVARMGAAYRAEIPEYAAMTDTELSIEVLPMSRRAVTAFFTRLSSGTESRYDLREFERSGRMRLEMGVPLDSVLHAYRIAGRVTWDAVVAAISPDEQLLLGALAGAWIDFIDQASCVVARGYVAASHERMRSVDARRRELVEAVLSASDAGEVAAVSLRFSTVLASSYVPVVVAGEGVAGRIDALLHASRPGTLGGHRGNRVLLLAPGAAPDVEKLQRLAGGLVTYGRAASPGDGLVEAVHEAERLADIASSDHGGFGVFGPDDLLIEQLMLAAPRVTAALRRRVADVLASRDPGGALEATLRIYLSCGSVPETARSVVVHPNTVSYRLARVRDLLGLDPRVPREAALLVLGLGMRPDDRASAAVS